MDSNNNYQITSIETEEYKKLSILQNFLAVMVNTENNYKYTN
jgi:hypothetical protein